MDILSGVTACYVAECHPALIVVDDVVWSIRINYYFIYFSTIVPSNSCVFLSCRPLVVNKTFSTGLVGVEVYFVSWLGQLEFKSLIIVIVIVDFQNIVCCLAWADLGVQITDKGKSLYIGSFCPAMTSLSRYL